DMIQIADPQWFHIPRKISRPLFSQRHFEPHPKLAQACICWENGSLWHSEDTFIHDHFLKKLTKALKSLDKIKSRRGLFHVEFILLPFVRHLPMVIETLDNHINKGTNCPTS